MPQQLPGLPDTLIDAETLGHLKELFASLTRDVELHTFVRAVSANGSNGKKQSSSDGEEALLLAGFTVNLCRELAAVSPRVRHVEHAVKPGAEAAATAGTGSGPEGAVSLFPSILIKSAGADQPVFRITGAPLGEEARVLVQSILLFGTGKSGMSAAAAKMLQTLKEPRHVRVFSSPGCPYCPGQALNGLKAALERPDLVTAECVTTDQFPDLARKYKVGSVPHTQFSETHSAVGLQPEAMFVYELVHLAPMPEDDAPILGADVDTEHLDLVILGGGPAGLSAAIYAARSGLSSVVLEKTAFGGQVTLTPVVENYPGFGSLSGQKLGEILAAHARQYAPLMAGALVRSITREAESFAVHTPDRVYRAKALLFATGAEWKDMGVPGEDRLRGKGVVHCASCDGYLFKGKEAVIVGGGNTALTDALHLKNLGVSVRIMHRRDQFRAEDALQKAVEREGIPILWNSVPVEVLGKDSVTGLRIKDAQSGKESVLDVAGVFVAVGQKPHSELAVSLGVAVTPAGAIIIDGHMRTNVPGIYAAGDVCGGAQQIVTAVGEGAKAALAVFEDLQKGKS